MIGKLFPVFSLIAIVCIGSTCSEIFSSMDQLTQLSKTIDHVPKYLEAFVKIQQEKLSTAQKLIQNYKNFAKNANSNTKEFMGNPVNSFLMIKMLTRDLQKFFELFNPLTESTRIMDQIKEEHTLPFEEDYRGAVTALTRLEDTYLLSPSELRLGKFGSSVSIRPLNAFECFEFGRIAQENDDHFHALRWLDEAEKQRLAEGDNASVSQTLIFEFMAFSNFKQGNLYPAYELTKKLLDQDPNNRKFIDNFAYYQRAMAEQVVKKLDNFKQLESTSLKQVLEADVNNIRPNSYLGTEREAYEKLCREPNPALKSRLDKLTCRYANHHPLLRIAPVKQEQVFDDPPIFVFYDVLSEKQAERMIELARPKLDRARVSSLGEDGRGTVSNIRISKNGWLLDQEDKILPDLSKMVSAITNLSMETAEEWQMNNYGLGGVYEPHEDFSRKTDSDYWDGHLGLRIATWMFYIEAPEMGGATVFPTVGARVSPVNRSAVFWYNLLRSGEGDYRTRHAACPVLVGSKWVSNKWIRSKGQMFRRPCDLTYQENESYLMKR